MKVLCTVLLAVVLSACGYHTAGHAETVPATVHTVAIPAFTNGTTRYRLSDELPQAIAREFITRTRYRIVSNPQDADAVLQGVVLGYTSFPTVYDPTTSRASAVELHVTMRLSLVERATGKVLFNRPVFEVRERYQISTDAATYVEESDAAIARASQQTARIVVSSILENF